MAAPAVGPNLPGLGESRRSILAALKRLGRAAVPELADRVGLNVETVREHVRSLVSQRLARRSGTRRSGPGRPEVLYALTAAAEDLFPRREGELLRAFAVHLKATGRQDVLRNFLDDFVERRRATALERVRGLEGRERLEEAARILSEDGFMAVVEEPGGSPGSPRLRLCHCPFRDLVAASRLPCRAEIGFVHDLVGQGLARVSYIPDGDASCSYATEAAP